MKSLKRLCVFFSQLLVQANSPESLKENRAPCTPPSGTVDPAAAPLQHNRGEL